MAQIGIIGGGNLGANTAFFLAEKNIADVRLYDIQEGVPIGKALDMMEAAPLRGYQYSVSGTNQIAEVVESDVIVISAGEKRAPGMKRSDLYEQNAPVIRDTASQLKAFDGVVIVMTEPVDILTNLFGTQSGLPWQRVMGIGGLLDSLRLRHMIATELSVAPEDVAATVVGPHSEKMLPLRHYTSVAGVPIDMLIAPDRINTIFEEVRKAGDRIVELRSSSYYGPAAAAADLAEAIIRDTHRVFPVSFSLTGQLGMDGVAMSLPAVIGRNGIGRVLEPKLSDAETEALKSAAAEWSRA